MIRVRLFFIRFLLDQGRLEMVDQTVVSLARQTSQILNCRVSLRCYLSRVILVDIAVMKIWSSQMSRIIKLNFTVREVGMRFLALIIMLITPRIAIHQAPLYYLIIKNLPNL